MMQISGLFEHDTRGPQFTRTNKHVDDVIYSRIDIMICNRDCIITYENYFTEILTAHISDHSPIRIIMIGMPIEHLHPAQPYFKFVNIVVENILFYVVQKHWKSEESGKP